ncbi:hypothetical protein HRI_003100100 [Hibiscus trionum]|uniref:Integrase catalytic domain-containing protein n=1 Tax=Hibiscus trionum TaxID=183268 RepID=A0A9W7MAJ6_HIBTR|nr:hypothetical protein HRI_003100100 [Hibiscus trionum]
MLAQSFVKSPHTNGQVDAVNKKFMFALKKKVEDANGAWVDELQRYCGHWGQPLTLIHEKHHSIWHTVYR